MKKINIIQKIMVPALLLTLISSCADDFLTLEPKTSYLEANAYKTEADAFNAVVAVYDAFSVQNWNIVSLQADIVSDDVYTGGEPGGGMWQWQDQEVGIIDTENGAAADLWSRLYSGIYRANMFFEKEPGIEWVSDAKRQRYHAEVSVLRAWFNWDLARHYGWAPLIKELLPSSEDYKDAVQATPDELYQFIVEELVGAIDGLPETIPATEAGRITKDVARVLLARVVMYYEDFVVPVMGATATLSVDGTLINKAYVAQLLKDIIESERYQLLPDYEDVFAWDNENNAESIFEIQYSEKSFSGDWGLWTVDGNAMVIFLGPRNPSPDSVYSTGWSFGTLTWSLIDEFEPADNVRFHTTVFNADMELDSYTKSYQNTGYFNRKYMPRKAYYPLQGTAELNYPKNFIEMRLAEVYLMASELYLDTDPDLALDYLNEVRTRAMGDAAALNSITLDAIYHEKRVEFACEGVRKWDLMRRGLDYATDKIDASWDVPETVPNIDDFTGHSFNRNAWGMLPIPASEIRLANPGVLMQYVPAFQ
ncbi:MAG: RagB/SusD family nutrient uptake outer membrane protein [Bacteroidota bacterium]